MRDSSYLHYVLVSNHGDKIPRPLKRLEFLAMQIALPSSDWACYG